MKVLVVGGAGSVGTAVIPHLARRPRLRVFDLAQPLAVDFYGLAKQFGEHVGRAAVLEHGLDVVALRLCFPIRDEEWPPQDPKTATIATSGRDVASALEAALAYQHQGFDVFAISGDAAG